MTTGSKRQHLQLELARSLTSPEMRVRAPKRIFDESPSDWRGYAKIPARDCANVTLSNRADLQR